MAAPRLALEQSGKFSVAMRGRKIRTDSDCSKLLGMAVSVEGMAGRKIELKFLDMIPKIRNIEEFAVF